MKNHILSEIKRLAKLNEGQPPGQTAFESKTGIASSKWRGKHWARWGDALAEAGFPANKWNEKSDPEALLLGMIAACRHYGKYPTRDEVNLLRLTNEDIPSPVVVQRHFLNKGAVVAALKEFVSKRDEYADIIPLLPEIASTSIVEQKNAKAIDGNVYLIKYGEHFKIGRGIDLEKRVKQVLVSLPEAGALIHSIKTDDPSGIEAYWHRRFKDRRVNGEFFRLTPDDVKSFMRRTFQ
jgi:Meiotically up-regulated gene 113